MKVGSHRGGGGTYLVSGALTVESKTAADPRFVVDRAMAQEAFRIASSWQRAHGASGHIVQTRISAGAAGVAKTCCKQLALGRTITTKQRKALENILGPDRVAAIRERLIDTAGSETPESLRRENLPLKPPGKR